LHLHRVKAHAFASAKIWVFLTGLPRLCYTRHWNNPLTPKLYT